jgi:hypothetical protein
MAQLGQRKCLCCRNFFDLDARNRERQRYCSNTECRRASKAASQAAWLAKPQNGGYFCDPVHVARVQAWRVAHPGYSRGKARSPAALQDPLLTQLPEKAEECPIRGEIAAAASPTALQDLLSVPTPVLAELIAHLFQGTLQDDLSATTRRLVRLGHDVINNSRDEDSQESTAARVATPGKSYRSKDQVEI